MKKQNVLRCLSSLVIISFSLLGCTTASGGFNLTIYNFLGPVGPVVAYYQAIAEQHTDNCSERTKRQQVECQKQVDELVRSIAKSKKHREP